MPRCYFSHIVHNTEHLSAAEMMNMSVLGWVFGAFNVSWDKLTNAELWLAQLFRGLNDGATYAAVALGLVLIYKATGFINFAQGSLALLGTYVVYVLSVEQGLPVVVAVLCAMVTSAALAAVVERVLIRPFPPDHVLPLVIVSIGLLLIIDSAVGIVWGFRTRRLPSMFPDGAPIEWGIAQLTWRTIGNLGTVLAAVGLVYLLLTRTKVGLAFRAVSSNLESAHLVGIRVGPTLGFGWALAAAIGTLGGALVVPDLLLEPSVMLRVLIFSLAAAALGGLDSMLGAVLGGLVVGLARNLLVTFLDISELALATAVAVILVVLLVRPTGLFGSTKVQRA